MSHDASGRSGGRSGGPSRSSKRARKGPDDLLAQRLVALYIFATDERSTVDEKFTQKRMKFSACVFYERYWE